MKNNLPTFYGLKEVQGRSYHFFFKINLNKSFVVIRVICHNKTDVDFPKEVLVYTKKGIFKGSICQSTSLPVKMNWLSEQLVCSK